MKKSHFYIFFAAVALVLTQCRTKDVPLNMPTLPEIKTGSVQVNVEVVYDGALLSQGAFNPTNSLGQKEKFTGLKFYLSDVKTTAADGAEINLSDVALINYFGNETTFNFELPEGEYTNLSIRVGLNEAQNAMDPATFVGSHPMSANQGMHWGWNTNYKFVEMEGWLDSDASDADNNDVAFAYHCGTNGVSFEKQAFTALSISEGETTNITLIIDAKRLLADGANQIDPTQTNQSITHSSGAVGVALAAQFMTNLSAAISFE